MLNAKPKHPVVIVPGFVNTGLSVKSKPCIAKRRSLTADVGAPRWLKAITGRVGWNTWDWTRTGKIQTESS